MRTYAVLDDDIDLTCPTSKLRRAGRWRWPSAITSLVWCWGMGPAPADRWGGVGDGV